MQRTSFVFRDQLIHYELHGEGQPLLLLNGIMMSTLSWYPFLKAFQQGGNQVILLDLMDQGKSAAYEAGYGIADQAQMVLALLDHLSLDRVSVMGTSYGGAVALSLASRWPERIDRLMLAGTRAYTDPQFRGMCEAWLHSCHSPQALYSATMSVFYGGSFQQREQDWLEARRGLLERTAFSSPDFLARFCRLVRSIMDFDIRQDLQHITSPTLVLSAEEDLVMMPWEQQRIAELIPGAHLLSMHKTGHVMFLENPSLFIPLMMGWFNHRDSIRLP